LRCVNGDPWFFKLGSGFSDDCLRREPDIQFAVNQCFHFPQMVEAGVEIAHIMCKNLLIPASRGQRIRYEQHSGRLGMATAGRAVTGGASNP
jgi:hypothetical protein